MSDADLIRSLGGPAKVARLLELDGHGVQRVHNWMTRGIPAAIKVQYPHLFMPELTTHPAAPKVINPLEVDDDRR